jgi:hypothetical protein
MAMLREIDTVMATIADLHVGTSYRFWSYDNILASQAWHTQGHGAFGGMVIGR